jgi:hypothetical protein
MNSRQKTALFWSLQVSPDILASVKKLLSGLAEWVGGFATHFFASFRLTFLIKKENALTSVFFRSRTVPNEYYAADPKVAVNCGVTVVTWVLKKVGQDQKIVVNTKDLNKDYEACSPYEALGSTLV